MTGVVCYLPAIKSGKLLTQVFFIHDVSPLKLRSVLPSIIIDDTYKCNCSQKNPNKLNLFIYLQLAWLVRLEWLTGFISATQLDIRESDQMFFPKSGIFTVTWLILSNFQKIYVKILSRKSLKCPIEAILWNSWSVWRCKHTVPAVSISQSNFVLVFFFLPRDVSHSITQSRLWEFVECSSVYVFVAEFRFSFFECVDFLQNLLNHEQSCNGGFEA